VTDPAPRSSWRRGALVFLLGAICFGAASGVGHAVFRDDAWDWAEFAFRALGGGLTVLLFERIIPPARYRKIQRAGTVALWRGRLPRGIDRDLWREALQHQRGIVWLWRRFLPALLAGTAGMCAVAALLGGTEATGMLWVIGAALAAGATGSFVAGERRRSTIDDLLAQLDEPGVHAG
jgi:hypothetical protein